MAEKRKLGEDPHSYANFKEVRVSHLAIKLKADFARERFHGHVVLTLDVLKDGATYALLDTKNIAIEACFDDATGDPLDFTMPESHRALGICLKVSLPTTGAKKHKIRIEYSTTQRSGGIQWFRADQTQGGKHPYVYTQCEAILARTLLPCQDTPAVKAPYTIAVTVPSPLAVVCSGAAHETNPSFEDDGSLTYQYTQKQPIPSYLIAIVAGALKKAKLGPRSYVWSERELLEASVHEFSADTETFLRVGEELTGIPYSWGVYDLVVLPSFFPYGGMENPNATFLSASLLVGDRSLVNVVCHEAMHSWAGNLVTNSNWTDFWLNEGFCVYLERQVLGKIHGDEYRYFEMLIGYNDLVKTVASLPAGHSFASLTPDFLGVDPDDGFTKIPYEKGSLFLFYLEEKVGGKDAMLGWLSAYYKQYQGQSLCSNDFQRHFLEYFRAKGLPQGTLDSIAWEEWLRSPGMPSYDPTQRLQNKYTKACSSLAEKWIKNNGEGTTADDLSAFSSKQKMYFLDLIQTGALPMAHDLLDKMDKLYGLSTAKNVEVLFRFLMIALKSGKHDVKHSAAHFLSQHGRGLYVKPLYNALDALDHAHAVHTWAKEKHRYHSVIRNMFDAALKQ